MKQTGCQEYQKVLSYFYDLVKDGTLTWGSKLPTERKIAEQLGIGVSPCHGENGWQFSFGKWYR